NASQLRHVPRVRIWFFAAPALAILVAAAVAAFLQHTELGRLLPMAAMYVLFQGFLVVEAGGRIELDKARRWAGKLNQYLVAVGSRAIEILPKRHRTLGLAYSAAIVVVLASPFFSPWGLLVIPLI